MTLIVYLERDQNIVSIASLEALTLACTIADDPVAVIAGKVSSELTQQLTGFGVSRAITIEHEVLCDYAPEALGASLAQLIESKGATALIAPGTETGNEVMAHVAARLDAPLATNCIEVQFAGSDWELTRLRWGGVLFEDAKLAAPVKLATVAPHSVIPQLAPESLSLSLEAFRPDIPDELARTRVVARSTRSDGITLTTAPVVVSGGRGVGSADGFALLEELAAEIGGAVGCSRVATNNGWRSHSDQVGQTGTRIAPQLYIACGISGATQHWAGCMGSKHILAINTDPEAPLVQRAGYAVIGDLHGVLPAIIDEIRRRKAAQQPAARSA